MKTQLSCPRLARRCSPRACNAEKGADATAPRRRSHRRAGRRAEQWRLDRRSSAKTPEGGFLMGNPNAKVKLVEFGSLTCPHCAEFEEQGGKPLVDNYVKKGLVQLRIPQLRPRSVST